MKQLFQAVALCCLLSPQLNAQITIWAENFNSYTNGIVTGSDNNAPTGNDWTSGGCPSCAGDSNDWWEIRNGRIEARDVNNDLVFLQTEVIDISGWTSVDFSVLCTEQGDHDGIYLTGDVCANQSNEDFADVYYRIDGGAWQHVVNYLGWCGLYASCAMHTFYGDEGLDGDCRSTDDDWVSSNVQIAGLSGSTLEIRLEARNSAASEYIQFDNIEVQGFLFLPVVLMDFSAKIDGANTELKWFTASEHNNSHFEIEYSLDGVVFEKLGMVQGSGNSESIKNYDFTHSVAEYRTFDVIYYRLKQVDFNGAIDYSEIIAVEIGSLVKEDLILYPNPARDLVNIETPYRSNGFEVSVYDFSGRLMMKDRLVSEQNTGKRLDTQHLPAGLYVVLVDDGLEVFRKVLEVIH